MESKKRKNYWGSILVIIGFIFLFSCSTEPTVPNYERGLNLSVDSAVLNFYSSQDSFLFSHPLNLTGVLSNQLQLDTNQSYLSELLCFSNGIDQSALIKSQSRFYLFTGDISGLSNGNLLIKPTDVDNLGLTVGLKNTWNTSTVTSDSLIYQINGWYYAEAVKGLKAPTGMFFDLRLPVKLK